MEGRRSGRKPFWIGMAVGFGLGVGATFAGLLGLALWAAHVVEKSGVVDALPPPALPAAGDSAGAAARGRMSYSGWVEDLAGGRRELASLAGRVAVVHLWATWCGPCVRELPQIQALADSLAGDGVAVVAISEEDPRTVRVFLEKRGLRPPVYVARQPLPEEFRTSAIPATFIVAPDGAIVVKQVGAAGWDHASVRRYLRGMR
jgi:thiol-disulfide isomerase/thioredoxin